MPFYCELFDTARNEVEERAAARTLLQLGAVVGPTDLTAIHAANSRLILDDCAGDNHFLELVGEGRVRFRNRHDDQSPEQWLRAALQQPEAILIWGDSLAERRDVLETIKNPHRPLQDTDQALQRVREERIARAHELWAASTAGYERARMQPLREQSVANQFATGIEHVIQDIPSSRPGVIKIFDEIIARRQYANRTQVYRLLREFEQHTGYGESYSRGDVKDAFEIADAVYSLTVARSLEQHHFSALGRVKDLGAKFHQRPVDHAATHVEAWNKRDQKAFRHMKLDWLAIKHAAGDADASNRTDACVTLAKELVNTSVLVEDLPEVGLAFADKFKAFEGLEKAAAGVLASAAGAYFVHVPVPVIEAVVSVAFVVAGLAVPKAIEERLKERRQVRYESRFHGYLERLDPPRS